MRKGLYQNSNHTNCVSHVCCSSRPLINHKVARCLQYEVGIDSTQISIHILITIIITGFLQGLYKERDFI